MKKKDKNGIILNEFFSSSRRFLFIYGPKGLGKSYYIYNYYASAHNNNLLAYIKFSADKNNNIPLINLSNSLKVSLTNDVYFFSKYIANLNNHLIVIENFNDFQNDEKTILLNAIEFLVHQDKNTKIIFEYDKKDDSNIEDYFIPKLMDNNIYRFEEISQKEFKNILNSKLKGNRIIKNKILEVSNRNFYILNKIIIKLKFNNYIIEKDNSYYIKKNVTLDKFVNLLNQNINFEYNSLNNSLKDIIDYSSIIGLHILEKNLEHAFDIKNVEKKLNQIYTQTTLILNILDHPIDYLFENIYYKFANEDTKNLIYNKQNSTFRYEVLKRTTNYLEYVISQKVYNNVPVYLYEDLANLFFRSGNKQKALQYYNISAKKYKYLKLIDKSIECYKLCFKIEKNKIFYKEILIELEYLKKEDDLLKFIEVNKNYIYDNFSKYYQAIAMYRKGYPYKSRELLDSIERKNDNYYDSKELDVLVQSLYSSIYDWINNPKKMKQSYKHAIKSIEKLDNPNSYVANLVYKKIDMIIDFDIPESQQKMIAAYNFFLSNEHYVDAYECAHNIGIEYLYINDLNKAYKYFETSYNGFDKIKNPNIYVVINSLGIYMMLIDEFQQALNYFKKINTDIIEEFCRWCVLINIDICKIKLNEDIDIKKYDKINYQKSKFVSEDNRIPAVLLQILLGIYYLNNDKKQSNASFLSAIENSKKNNKNFKHLIQLAEYFLKENNLGINNSSSLTSLCICKKIIFGEIMFWGN